MELEPHLPQLYTGLDSARGGPCPQCQHTTRNSLAPAALTAGTRPPPPQTPPPPYRHSTSGATARGDHCVGRILLLGNRGLPAVACPTHSVGRFQSASQCQQTRTHWQVQAMQTTRPPTHTQDQQVFSGLLVLRRFQAHLHHLWVGHTVTTPPPWRDSPQLTSQDGCHGSSSIRHLMYRAHISPAVVPGLSRYALQHSIGRSGPPLFSVMAVRASR